MSRRSAAALPPPPAASFVSVPRRFVSVALLRVYELIRRSRGHELIPRIRSGADDLDWINPSLIAARTISVFFGSVRVSRSGGSRRNDRIADGSFCRELLGS